MMKFLIHVNLRDLLAIYEKSVLLRKMYFMSQIQLHRNPLFGENCWKLKAFSICLVNLIKQNEHSNRQSLIRIGSIRNDKSNSLSLSIIPSANDDDDIDNGRGVKINLFLLLPLSLHSRSRSSFLLFSCAIKSDTERRDFLDIMSQILSKLNLRIQYNNMKQFFHHFYFFVDSELKLMQSDC